MNKKIYGILVLLLGAMLFLTGCKKESYMVVFESNEGTYVVSQKVEEGEKAIRPVNPTKSGYEFEGWYLSNDFIDKYEFDTAVTRSLTLYAKYIKSEYTIVCNFGYDDDQNSEIVFTNPDNVILPTPSRIGYKFLGWYDDNNNQIIDVQRQNYNLTAKWKKTHYIIEFTDGNNTYNMQLVEIGASLEEPKSLTKEGYDFLGWYYNDQQYDFSSVVDSDMKIVAKWEAKKYAVRFVTYTQDIIESYHVEYGTIINEPETPIKEGYEFMGWDYLTDSYDFSSPVTSNITLLANWEITKEYLDAKLNSLVPEEMTQNSNFIKSLDFCSAIFEWSSSNEEAVTSEGKIRQLAYDASVTIKVEVIYPNNNYYLEFETIVPKINLKPLNKGSIVSGYLYGAGGFTDLSEIALSQIDYINFSFASIVSGEISLPDDKHVEQILKYRKHGVRIGLAIGGWGAGGFSEAMSTEASRTKLINSIMKVLKEYQFDGIDIDWEYPTSSVAGIVSSPSDRNNLTLFAKELSAQMKAYRSDLVLSIAIAPSNTFYDLKELNKYMDYFNVMTYDFSMGTKASHDSNLYSNSIASSSMDNSVNFVKKYVDANKIIPGAAFYGRYGSFSGTSNAKLGGTLSVAMSKAISYHNLKLKIDSHNMVELYDVTAEAAYIIHGTTYYSYDNSRSVLAKCDYVKINNLAGLMCWEITQDYVDSDGKYELLDAMYQGLKK